MKEPLMSLSETRGALMRTHAVVFRLDLNAPFVTHLSLLFLFQVICALMSQINHFYN